MIIHKLDINLINSQNELVDALIYTNNPNICLNNVKIIKKYPFINAVAVRGDKNYITSLSNLNSVTYICSVGKIRNFYADNDKNINFSTVNNGNFLLAKNLENQDNFNIMHKYTNNMYKNINDIFNKNTNNVAILDTGVASHLDLCAIKSKVLLQVDFINNKSYNYDDNGHGTFVSGVISSCGILSGGKIKGICPSSNLISIKIMDSKGESTVFQALDGMQWVADNYKQYNIKVVCMSFGTTPLQNDPLLIAVQSLYNLGLTVVCASGNSGKNSFMSPAISPYVISVGSVDKNYNISTFCSMGFYKNYSYPYVYAIGENVIGLSNKNSYVSMSGTSVSCPVVCGYILRLYNKIAGLKNSDIKFLIDKYSIKKSGIKILDKDVII